MVKLNGFYKCGICGNLVSVLEKGLGDMVCCGESMKLLKENGLKEEGNEKHVPIVKISDNNVNVKVGSIAHPMLEEHYIVLIQIVKGKKVLAEKRLFPSEKSEANFCFDKKISGLKARIVCNMHGLWVN